MRPTDNKFVRVNPPASWVCVVLVLVTTFAAFSPSLNFEFVYDDQGQIVDNPEVQSWGYLPRYFTAHVGAHFSPAEAGRYYRPVFLLWLRVNHMLFGLTPWWWHLTTVLAHLAATLLVYLLASTLLRDSWGALFSAFVFGLHSAHVEAVAWIAGVTEPLLAVLFIGSILCHLQANRHHARAPTWRAISLALFALALLAKETAMVLPIVVLAYEWVCGERPKEPSVGANALRRLLRALGPSSPYWVLLPLYVLVRFLVLKRLSPFATPYSFTELCLTWPSLIWFWIKHLVWPTELGSSYNFPAVTNPGWGNFALPALGVALVATALYWVSRRSGPLKFATVWMLVPLLPTMNLPAFAESDFAHDRYLYLPSVGFAMIIAVLLRRIPATRLAWLGLPITQAATVVILVILMAFNTVRQSFYLANDEIFYHHNARIAPDNQVAISNLGMWLRTRGDYEAAIRVFTGLTEKYPGSWSAAHNLAMTYYKQGNLEAADAGFRRAILINPSEAQAYLYLGLTRFRMNRVDDAERLMRQAIQLRPGGQGYHFALGMVLKTRGDVKGAREEFNVELTNFPWETAARQQLKEIEANPPGR